MPNNNYNRVFAVESIEYQQKVGYVALIYVKEDFLCDLIDQELEDLKDALAEAFEKWGRETGNPYWIEIPIKGTERLYDLKTGKPVEGESK